MIKLIQILAEILIILMCLVIETYLIKNMVLDIREQNLKYKYDLMKSKKTPRKYDIKK